MASKVNHIFIVYHLNIGLLFIQFLSVFIIPSIQLVLTVFINLIYRDENSSVSYPYLVDDQ